MRQIYLKKSKKYLEDSKKYFELAQKCNKSHMDKETTIYLKSTLCNILNAVLALEHPTNNQYEKAVDNFKTHFIKTKVFDEMLLFNINKYICDGKKGIEIVSKICKALEKWLTNQYKFYETVTMNDSSNQAKATAISNAKMDEWMRRSKQVKLVSFCFDLGYYEQIISKKFIVSDKVNIEKFFNRYKYDDVLIKDRSNYLDVEIRLKNSLEFDVHPPKINMDDIQGIVLKEGKTFKYVPRSEIFDYVLLNYGGRVSGSPGIILNKDLSVNYIGVKEALIRNPKLYLTSTTKCLEESYPYKYFKVMSEQSFRTKSQNIPGRYHTVRVSGTLMLKSNTKLSFEEIEKQVKLKYSNKNKQKCISC